MRFLRVGGGLSCRWCGRGQRGVFPFPGFILLLFLLLLLVCPAHAVETAPGPSDAETPSEFELKAIYLYNFLQFVQWPSKECLLPDGHAREIVVIGDTELAPVLKSLQDTLREKNKELSLVFHDSYQDGMDLSHCCLLFIAASEQKSLGKILKSVEGKHVLTVADSDAFAQAGVMITLLSSANKIRWAINRKPVTESGLKMSAKLLEIAEVVIE